MGIVNGLRTLGTLLAGGYTSGQLETALSTGAARASLEQALNLKGQSALLAANATAFSTAIGSATARATLLGNQTALAAIASNPTSRTSLMASARSVLLEIAASVTANRALLDYFPWRQNRAARPAVFYAATFGGTRFVAVGGGNPVAASAVSSTDGINWQADVLPLGDYRAVTYGAGRYVAVGVNVCATSTDGATWTLGLLPSGSYLGVAFDSGTFVAVGVNVCATSTDGTTWTARTIPAGTYNAVAFGAGLFAAVGASICATSPGGTTWTARSIPTATYNGIAFGAGVFSTASSNTTAAYSANGISWSSGTNSLADATAIAWSGSEFVTITSIAANVSSRSTNGTSWTTGTTTASAPRLNSIAFGAGVFAALGNGESGVSSPTGVTFTDRKVFTTALRDVCWGNGQYLAVGDSGGVAVSSDGQKWVSRPNPTASTQNMSSVAYGNGVYVALHTGIASCYTSVDGATWVSRTVPRLGSRVRFVNGLFTIVTSPVIDISRDGITWASYGLTGGAAGTVIYGNGVYVALNSGTVYEYSYSAATWFNGSPLTTSGVSFGAFGNDLFVAATSSWCHISRDGVNWQSIPVGSCGLSGVTPMSMTFCAGHFYLLTASGTVFTSENGSFWTPQASALSAGSIATEGGIATDGTNVVAVTNAGSAITKV